MASKFYTALAAWLLCDICSSKYDPNPNRGLGATLFASICTMTASHDTDTADFVQGDAFYEAMAFFLIVWPGVVWGIVYYWLLSSAEDQAACLWLVGSSVFVVVLGLPVLGRYIRDRGPLRLYRIGGGLTAVGVLTGNFLSKSPIGRAINDFMLNIPWPLNTHPTFKAIIGVAIMFLSVAKMLHSQSQAAKDLQLTKRVSTDSLIHINLPPFWGLHGPSCVITWTSGLALCIIAMDARQGRAMLVSTSVLIVLTIAFLPPYLGRIWGRSYDDVTQGLFILHVTSVLICCVYYILIAETDAVKR